MPVSGHKRNAQRYNAPDENSLQGAFQVEPSTVSAPTARERKLHANVTGQQDNAHTPQELIFLGLYGTENPSDEDRGLGGYDPSTRPAWDRMNAEQAKLYLGNNRVMDARQQAIVDRMDPLTPPGFGGRPRNDSIDSLQRGR